MKIVNVNCPSCGAALKVNSELRTAVCNYCGKQFVIDPADVRVELELSESSGYNFEVGRMKARKEAEEAERVRAEISRREAEEKQREADEFEALIAGMKKRASTKIMWLFVAGLILSVFGAAFIVSGAYYPTRFGGAASYIGVGAELLALVCVFVILRTARLCRVKGGMEAGIVSLACLAALGWFFYSIIALG